MPWCPKCKNEYREGIRVCTDCGCELVEEEQFEGQVAVTFGDEEQMNSLKKFMEFNELKGVTVQFDEAEKLYELLVRKEDRAKASLIVNAFLDQKAVESEMQQEYPCEGNFDGETDLQDDAEDGFNEQEKSSYVRPTVYQNSTERAEENRSSAWALLVVGLIGIVAVVLGILEVLPFSVGNPYMFYGVMSAVFVLFIVMGIVSMKNAKVFEKKAESENTLHDAMVKWYTENLNATALDVELAESEKETLNDSLPQEMLYFKRAQLLKDKFNHQFMNLDQAFLEHFIDEEVYDAIFTKTGE